MRVARPKWVPKSDKERAAVDAVVEAVQKADAAADELRQAVLAADQLGVPRSHLAEASGTSRATFYRRLPQREG